MSRKTKFLVIRWKEIFVLNYLGRLSQGRYGATTRDIAKLIFLLSQGNFFTGDAALRDEVGYYRITGRVDDVIIVSGHNLGTAPIEDAVNEHQSVAESAIVGYRTR